ncbi:hypothetical protein KP509_27G018100 [Ceratopteris richardii]|uniref:BHLH domain-containing protein n=1 Tax=Ceratopteris richardii TaxID=49495 RepID=A0A8T2RE75_CERRI|nr:hypothetical protein KP509_27G018100 [Ceratopteris richardii]
MSSPSNGWISFWENNLLGDQQNFSWSDASLVDGALESDSFNIHSSSLTCSTENENSKGNSLHQESRKRSRDDGPIGAQGKACREKMRRDRMNDRFIELSAILEPDKPPKTDKASILRDAVRVIGQLRAEAQQYKEVNNQLHETIKELKAEKNELREEKLCLKAEKESLESKLKSVGLPALPSIQAAGSTPSGSQISHSFYAKALGTSSVYASQHDNGIFAKPPLFSDVPFSVQWIPSEVADVSRDHVLRPPVA